MDRAANSLMCRYLSHLRQYRNFDVSVMFMLCGSTIAPARGGIYTRAGAGAIGRQAANPYLVSIGTPNQASLRDLMERVKLKRALQEKSDEVNQEQENDSKDEKREQGNDSKDEMGSDGDDPLPPPTRHFT